MEYMHGKQSCYLSEAELWARLALYREVRVDIGTGDGRYVQQMAKEHPTSFVVGLDACRENLEQVSRHAPPNALYLIANALEMPLQLANFADVVTINFPWGSLLSGLLENNPGLLAGLRRLAHPGARLEIRLNGNALDKAGCYTPEEGSARVRQVLSQFGLEVGPVLKIPAATLRTYPTTWAKRLAYGREPHALYLKAGFPALLEAESRLQKVGC